MKGMSKVTVFNVNGESEVFNNVTVKTMCKFTSLKTLEDKVIRTGKGFKGYIDILKSVCGICKDEYVDSIDEIIDQVFIITVNYKINDRTFSNFFIDIDTYEDNREDEILDVIQSFVSKNAVTIFDGAIHDINWLNNEVNKLMR